MGQILKKNRKYRIMLVLCSGLILAAAAAFFHFYSGFPIPLVCAWYEITGLYCPGCGITRSITALLQGDPLAALRYNAAPFVLGLLLVFLYIEWGTDLFGTHRRLLPQQPVFWVVLGGVFGIYWVLRNFFPLG